MTSGEGFLRETDMKNTIKLAAAALVTVGGLAITTASASAAIVCNAEGECWHTKAEYAYRPEFGLTVHTNDWRWGATDHYTWREHTGRGYWHNGVWVKF
jgi:hypothetical protein